MHRRPLSRPLRLPLVAILIAASCTAWAQTPPAAPFDATAFKPTLRHAPAAGLRMGSLRIVFERTTLDEVRSAAGSSRVAHHGDAGDSVYWLCYTRQGPQAQRIWIVSSGEMGGPGHRVTGVSADLAPHGEATPDCPALPARLAPLSLDDRLWLGATPDQAAAALGTPSFTQDAWSSYDFQGKAPVGCPGSQGGADLSASLALHFRDGHADALRASRVTSC
jgi:hypothetical protein